MNHGKTVLLLGLLTGLFLFIGGAAGGRAGMLLALLFAAAMNFASLWFSDRIVLRAYGARELEAAAAPRVHAMTRELAQRAAIPMPALCVFDSATPNAFATGRSPRKATVALSSGIVQLMGEEELKGVIGHELSHIVHRDTLIQSVAATLAGAVMFLAHQLRWFSFLGGSSGDDDDRGGIAGLLLMAVLAPLAAMLIQMALSRSREYLADEEAARLTGNPGGLAEALQKLDLYAQRLPLPATAHTAHLFIVNPLRGGGLLSLFSTHPPIAERVARLRRLQLH